MYLHKIYHPLNFRFADCMRRGALRIGSERLGVIRTDYPGGIFRLELDGERWCENLSQAVLSPPSGTAQPVADLEVDSAATLWLRDSSGGVLLRGLRRRTFGVSGRRWLVNLAPDAGQRFYGLGEKWGSFEKTGLRTKFWNTDVWSDFARCQIEQAQADPLYVSVPYLIVRQQDQYVGILVDNPFAVFVSANASFGVMRPRHSLEPDSLFVGADDGRPVLYFIVGPTLRELTQKLQRLVGTTPRPPLWALGHHQSRWGYASYADLAALDRSFAKHRIPCDGLWLDIDYMDGFRVFTVARRRFKELRRDLSRLRERGRKVVAILDPGVKREPGYCVYDDARRQGHFCLTDEGQPFVGFAWPGPACFPDFSLPEVRAWWARRVARFAAQGFAGFWLDMNDPSVGFLEHDDMRFGRGRLSHGSYHNQYALGMAQASFAGLARARPRERPFLLSRSAYTSMSRFSAVWTGDNVSNEAHLLASIPTTLNLALSGIPFNGPDVPGFGGDADDDLMVRWYKACFLFPLLRNHSCIGTRRQEPWAMSRRTLKVIRHFIRLRYKLLPYLYNLFIEQEATGEAMLRPLSYDHAESRGLPLADVADQFLVGPSVMQAPCLIQSRPERSVVLPAGDWFDAVAGRWRRGGRRCRVKDEFYSTPLYVRVDSAIPMQRGLRSKQHNDLSDIELHVFLRGGQAELKYEFDDGLGYGYRRAQRTRLSGCCWRERRAVQLRLDQVDIGYRPCRIRVVSYGPERELVVVERGCSRRSSLEPARWNMAGAQLQVRVSRPWIPEPTG